MKKLFSIILLLGLLGTYLGISPEPTLAKEAFDESAASPSSTPQEVINLTVSPISLLINTDPAVPFQTNIKVRNNSQYPENLKVILGKFIADKTGNHPQLLENSAEDESMKWVKVTPEKFTVPPNEWQTIDVTFSPPATAALTYYYSLLIARDHQEHIDSPGKTVIQGAPAVLALATVNSPNARRELNLIDFKALYSMMDFLPQTLMLNVENKGNVHLIPSGNVFIDGPGKKDLAVLSINPSSLVVLPQSTRTFEIPWDDGFPVIQKDGDKSAQGLRIGSSFWDFSKADRFRFGKYTAHLLMVYDNGQRDVPIESTVSFWVIPWKILAILGIIFGLTALGLRFLIGFILAKIRSFFKSGRSSES